MVSGLESICCSHTGCLLLISGVCSHLGFHFLATPAHVQQALALFSAMSRHSLAGDGQKDGGCAAEEDAAGVLIVQF